MRRTRPRPDGYLAGKWNPFLPCRDMWRYLSKAARQLEGPPKRGQVSKRSEELYHVLLAHPWELLLAFMNLCFALMKYAFLWGIQRTSLVSYLRGTFDSKVSYDWSLRQGTVLPASRYFNETCFFSPHKRLHPRARLLLVVYFGPRILITKVVCLGAANTGVNIQVGYTHPRSLLARHVRMIYTEV